MSYLSATFAVPGKPIAQPRPRLTFRGGHARAYVPKSHQVWSWRKAIDEFASKHAPSVPVPKHVPVSLSLLFFFPRPKSHFTKKGKLVKGAPLLYHSQKPDLDNLAKPVMDVLENQGFYVNDSQIAELLVAKYWDDAKAGVPESGVRITIHEIRP